MKIAVVGAGGRTGRVFVETAVRAGHDVRAGAHHPTDFALNSSHLEVVTCDATDPKQVARLLHGCDAVMSLLGHVRGSAPDVQTRAMRAIVACMEERGPARIVSLTGTGVRLPGDHITFMDRILNAGISVIDPARVRDGRTHMEVIQQSALQWTVLRVLKLQNTHPSPYRLTDHGPTKLYVGRLDVAEALLRILEDARFIEKAPMMTSGSTS